MHAGRSPRAVPKPSAASLGVVSAMSAVPVFSSSVVLGAVVLGAAVAVAVPLGRSALSRWTAERAGRAYELPEDYRAAVLRATACAIVLCTGIVLAVALPGGRSGSGTASEAKAEGASAAGRGTVAPRPVSTGGFVPVPAHRPEQPAAPARTPAGGLRTLGQPAGGLLEQLPDGTRVWLPPQYAYPRARSLAFPLVVAYLPLVAADRQPLYPAFGDAVAAGRADPFVVVQPSGCAANPRAAVAQAARRYRILPGRRAAGVLGAGALAPCAVRAALAHPDAFAAAAGVSGAYDRGAVRAPEAEVAPPPHLMLASAAGDEPRRASALRLRAALRRMGVRVRIVDGVTADPRAGGGPRRRELALAAQYFTERLDGPRRVRHRSR
jgi:hypothetical protein